MKYLSRTIDNHGKGNHIEDLTEAPATLLVECFHFEQQNRLCSKRDAQEHVKYYREFFHESVVTWKGRKVSRRSNLAVIAFHWQTFQKH